jgi:hypothetical protein
MNPQNEGRKGGLAVTRAECSSGELQLALALGDFESLGRRRKPVIPLHLVRGAESGLTQLVSILDIIVGNKSILTT